MSSFESEEDESEGPVTGSLLFLLPIDVSPVDVMVG